MVSYDCSLAQHVVKYFLEAKFLACEERLLFLDVVLRSDARHCVQGSSMASQGSSLADANYLHVVCWEQVWVELVSGYESRAFIWWQRPGLVGVPPGSQFLSRPEDPTLQATCYSRGPSCPNRRSMAVGYVWSVAGNGYSDPALWPSWSVGGSLLKRRPGSILTPTPSLGSHYHLAVWVCYQHAGPSFDIIDPIRVLNYFKAIVDARVSVP